MEARKDADEATIPYVYSVPMCPPMRLEPGFVKFMSPFV